MPVAQLSTNGKEHSGGDGPTFSFQGGELSCQGGPQHALYGYVKGARMEMEAVARAGRMPGLTCARPCTHERYKKPCVAHSTAQDRPTPGRADRSALHILSLKSKFTRCERETFFIGRPDKRAPRVSHEAARQEVCTSAVRVRRALRRVELDYWTQQLVCNLPWQALRPFPVTRTTPKADIEAPSPDLRLFTSKRQQIYANLEPMDIRGETSTAPRTRKKGLPRSDGFGIIGKEVYRIPLLRKT